MQQRVRIGLMGLAVVFLLVLLAAALIGLTSDDRSFDAPDANQVTGAPENSALAEEPKEPLAELGVAPGYSGEGNGAASNVATPPQR